MKQLAAKLGRNASTAVILPIGGLVAGLIAGSLRARTPGPDEFTQIVCALKWGVTGFFAGLALVVLLAFNAHGDHRVSTRKLMGLVVVAAVLAWFFTQILFGLIGYDGF